MQKEHFYHVEVLSYQSLIQKLCFCLFSSHFCFFSTDTLRSFSRFWELKLENLFTCLVKIVAVQDVHPPYGMDVFKLYPNRVNRDPIRDLFEDDHR